MCSSSPPPAPDYTGAAVAQGGANLESARATAKLNNPNTISPYGTQSVSYGTGDMQDIPTVTQTLSPEQQGLYEKGIATKSNLGDLGITGSESLKGVIGRDVDFGGIPQVGSYDDTRKSVINAMMGRANEDYAKQSDQSNSDLIAAGIRPGTKAYADKQQMIERARTDARNQAEVAGGNAASQAFGMDTTRRNAAISEYLSKRQTPLNEINALMSGSQVSNPFAGNLGYQAGAKVEASPLFGATQAQGKAASDIYSADVAQSNSTKQSAATIGAAAMMMMF